MVFENGTGMRRKKHETDHYCDFESEACLPSGKWSTGWLCILCKKTARLLNDRSGIFKPGPGER